MSEEKGAQKANDGRMTSDRADAMRAFVRQADGQSGTEIKKQTTELNNFIRRVGPPIKKSGVDEEEARELGRKLVGELNRTNYDGIMIDANLNNVRDLVRDGAKIYSEALRMAMAHEQVDIVKFLIENGADVNCGWDRGATPLMYAVREGNKEIVELLLNAGADMNAMDREGTTALMSASSRGYADIVDLLVQRGADVDVIGFMGRKAVNFARDNVIRQMLEGKPFVPGTKVETVKEVDAAEAKMLGVQLLEETIERKTDFGKVKELIDNGADVDMRDKNGLTPLMYASFGGDVEVVDYLLRCGAYAGLRDNDGKTAADYAYRYDIRKMLQEAA